MELKVMKESVTVNEVICDSFTELPLECDVLLPDYCPDIMKVLKCCATPVFTQTAVEGSSLTVEGYALLELYYLSDTMKVRCSEHKTPFSRTVDLKSTPENPAVSTAAAVEYLNCRAVNQRRVDIRGAMTVNVRVISQKEESFVCDAQGGGVQLRREQLDTSCLAGCAQRQFTVREELELGQGKPAIGSIICKRARAVATDVRLIANKVVLKGELTLEVFYLSQEEESPQSMRYSLPVSQIIDLAGVDEECRCDLRLSVVGCELQPKADLDGETTQLSAEVTICASARAFRSGQVAAVCDAYSTSYEASFTQRPMSALRLLETVNAQHSYKEQLDLPDGVKEVLYLWSEAQFVGGKLEEKAAVLDGRLLLCLFGTDQDGAIVYFEKPVEFSHSITLPRSEENLLADISMQPVACEWSQMGDGRIEVRCEIAITGALYAAVKCDVMEDLQVDENRPMPRDGATALTIYFAQPGERIWDIAKRYHTSVAAVMEENSVDREQLPARTTLLIPMVV